MAKFIEVVGNLFDADVEAITNTVNCLGSMGAGLALQFKIRYPINNTAYVKACQRGEVQIGRMLIVDTGATGARRWIVNFPTKDDWRKPSKLSYVEKGLVALDRDIRRLGIRSIAIPPLGCGLGGLDWPTVRAMTIEALTDTPDVDVHLYGPIDMPIHQQGPVRRGR